MKPADSKPSRDHDAKRLEIAKASAKNREAIVSQIRMVTSDLDRFWGEIIKGTRNYLYTCEEDLRKVLQLFKEKRLLRTDREKAWKVYQETWQEINRRKRQASFESRVHLQQRAGDVKFALREHGPRVARERLQAAQEECRERFLMKEDFDEVRRSFDEAYKLIRVESEKRRREFDLKRAEYRRRLQDRLSAAYDYLHRKEDQADRIRSNLSDNRHKRDTARSADFACRVDQWITEGERQLDEVLSKVSEVRRQICELEDKLGQL